MPLSQQVRRVFFAILALAMLPWAAAPQPAFGQPIARTPRFVATAVSFKAIDETGWDWTGSDEVIVIFSDQLPDHGDLVTSIFGDVDAGETRNFAPAEACIAPRPQCDQGLPEVHFKVAMWENDDTDFPHGELSGGHNRLENGVYYGDDLIGRAEVMLTTEQLLADLPAVGASRDYVVRPAGGSGKYDITYRVTRLRDGLNIPPIGPPVVLVGISLQAVPAGADRIALTWSGAAGTSVDIYRDGTKLTTTQNDGTYADGPLGPGTYVYRVCNAGTSVCSADVPVTR